MGMIKQQMIADAPDTDLVWRSVELAMTRDEATELRQDIIDFVEDRAGALETGDREYFIDLLVLWAKAREKHMMMVMNGGQPYRNSDPKTSRQAAENTVIKRGSQRFRLLVWYNERLMGLTSEEAGELSGLAQKGAGYWKRISELRNMGYIQDTGQTRMAKTGNQQIVCQITRAGRLALESSV
jgi:hypothetical protein